MREIKFRGKRFDNGEFVVGDLTRYSEEMSYITVDLIEGEVYRVASKTVGQYTGLKDKNGREIYEGDILGKSGYWNLVVEFQRIMPVNTVQYNNSKGISINGFDSTSWEVIGNIHDSPDFLGVTPWQP